MKSSGVWIIICGWFSGSTYCHRPRYCYVPVCHLDDFGWFEWSVVNHMFIICSLVVGCSSVFHRLFLGGTPETMSSALVAGSASIDASALQLGCPPQVAENVLDRHVLTDDWQMLDMLSHWIILDHIGSYWIILDHIGSYWIISKGWTKFDNMFMPSCSCQTIFRGSDPAHVGNHSFKTELTERLILKTQLRQLRHAYAVCIDLDSGSNYSAGDSGFVAYVSGWDFRDSPNSERVHEISWEQEE